VGNDIVTVSNDHLTKWITGIFWRPFL